MRQLRILTPLFAMAITIPMLSCSLSTTTPSDPPTLSGDWVLVDTGTTDVVAKDGTWIGTTYFTMTTRSTFKEDGSLVTRKKFSYDPPPPWPLDTEFLEQGTWQVLGDTLIRDEWPGALGSLDSSRFTLTSTTLTLVPLHPINDYREVLTRP